MSVFDLLRETAVAALSGGGGVGAAVWKFSSYIHGINTRLLKLEERSDELAKLLDSRFDNLAKRFEAFDQEQRKKWDENEEGCRQCQQKLGDRFDTNRGEHGRFVNLTAFNSFVKEQNDQWQDLNRMLGRIEGEIVARRGSWTNET